MRRDRGGSSNSKACWISPHRLMAWRTQPDPEPHTGAIIPDEQERYSLARIYLSRLRMSAGRSGVQKV